MPRAYVKKTKEERQAHIEAKLAKLERKLVLNDTRAQKYSDSLEPLRKFSTCESSSAKRRQRPDD